ncbi:MAG: pyridoxamine 5'-phosphate oxidase family protein [Spirochaetaceae bacterium]|jgi:general stress protein 26|nr:pyridoxamine 5'-phosphate oxidase family protein [Spirochaetaceae bacterium]
MNDTVKKNIMEIVKSCETVTLGTYREIGEYPDLRTILNTLNCENTNLVLHFFTSNISHKMQQILKKNYCCLYFLNSDTRMALRLFGTFAIYNEPDKKNYWRDDWKKFGYSGPEDTRWAVLTFTPKQYKYYTGSTEFAGEISEDDLN